MINTHPHIDHVGGLGSIVTNLDVDHVLYSGVFFDAGPYLVFERQIHELEAKGTLDVTEVDDQVNRTFSIGHGAVTFTELTDTTGLRDQYYNLDNDNALVNNQSLVYRCDYGGVSILMCGDAERDRQKQLIKDHKDLLDADILDLPHHGYNNFDGETYLSFKEKGHSANIDFFKAVSPSYAICSHGTSQNSVPSRYTLNDLKMADVYATYDQANKTSYEAIIITIKGGSMTFTEPDATTIKPRAERKKTNQQ